MAAQARGDPSLLGGLARLIGGLVLVCLVVGLLAASALNSCEVDLVAEPFEPSTGDESVRLPVEVTPRTGLTDGAAVRVRSDAFDADLVVALAVCLREADTDRRGVDACDVDGATRVAVDGAARLDQTVAVPRVITVAGRAHDCAATPGRCLLVAASASDFDESGGQPLEFAPDLPAVDLVPREGQPTLAPLPASATPSGPYRGRTEVVVTATGLRPHEPVLLARCGDQLPLAAIEDACEPFDEMAALFAIGMDQISSGLPTADADGTVVVTMAVAQRVDPYAGGQPAIDCTSRADRCSLVVAAAADWRRAAIVPYTIAPA